jgi:hypothetical protein
MVLYVEITYVRPSRYFSISTGKKYVKATPIEANYIHRWINSVIQNDKNGR